MERKKAPPITTDVKYDISSRVSLNCTSTGKIFRVLSEELKIPMQRGINK